MTPRDRAPVILAAVEMALIVAAALILASLARADGDGAPSPPPRPREWRRSWLVEATAPITRRVAFVIDVSGSMRGAPLALARVEVETILSLYPDDGRARLWAFSSLGQLHEFPGAGLEREGGWLLLPSVDLVEAASVWIDREGCGGSTALGDAVARALDACPEEDLAMVLVTDGEPDDPLDGHAAEIADAQARRVSPAPIYVILVRESRNDRDASSRALSVTLAHPIGAALLLELVRADGELPPVIPVRAPIAPPW